MSRFFLFSFATAPNGAGAKPIFALINKVGKQTINKQHRRNQMKFNKWTLGLAAVGVVSLASAARADEKMNSLQTALSNTTISGYVSASANWELLSNGSGRGTPADFIPFQSTKQNGFNLDVV